jgi:serine protease Do
MNRFAWRCLCSWLMLASCVAAQTREEKVRNDRRKVESEGFWIYNDLAKGFEQARETGKPMLVVLRCLPCTECVKLDDDLVDKHPRVRPLLEKFVCVRVVSTNGLDLSLFQFDTDQSFAAFLLNADRTIYGCFGTRSHRTEWLGDVSVEGLAAALEGALELHQNYPANRDRLAGKKGAAPDFTSPEKFPTLKDKYTATLNYEGNVVQSCIHCHQIGDAQRDWLRGRDGLLTEKVLFPYPHPKQLGLVLDPNQRAALSRVEPGSLAEQAGFQAGDQLTTLNGQPLLSIADVQWILQETSPAGATLEAEVRRNDRTIPLKLTLPKGWRQRGDISWRASTWGLRRMATGGMLLESLSRDDAQKAGLAESAVGLRAKHVGQFGPHAAAKNAGFRAGDIIVSFDGQTNFVREADLLAYAILNHKPGDQVAVTVMRDGKKLDLTLPMQP